MILKQAGFPVSLQAAILAPETAPSSLTIHVLNIM